MQRTKGFNRSHKFYGNKYSRKSCVSESVTSDPSNDSEPRTSLEVDSPSSNVGLALLPSQ